MPALPAAYEIRLFRGHNGAGGGVWSDSLAPPRQTGNIPARDCQRCLESDGQGNLAAEIVKLTEGLDVDAEVERLPVFARSDNMNIVRRSAII